MALQISERRAVEILEALAAALSQSLNARQADPGDSRPPIVIESNPKK